MPLKLTKLEQLSTLNKWSDDIEKRLGELERGLRFTQGTTATHKNIFTSLFSNPQTLQKNLSNAGISLNANVAHPGSTTVSAVGGSPIFNFTSTATSISWTWAASTIYWPDGTQHVIPNNTQAFGGAYTVTGLANTTDYYFFPYWDYQTQAFTWVSGCNCTGTPCTAFTLANSGPVPAALQNANGHFPLANGAIKGTTGSSGSSTGNESGGGRVGDNGCHPPYLVVERKTGPCRIDEVRVGDCLLARNGWTTIRQKHISPQEEFIRVRLRDGSIYETTPMHTVMTLLEEKFSDELHVGDWMFTRDGVGIVEAVERFNIPNGSKVVLHCEPHPEFFIGLGKPYILAHNSRFLS